MLTLPRSLIVFERSLLASSSLFRLVSRLVFLQAAERCLLGPGQGGASLSALVLYTCLAGVIRAALAPARPAPQPGPVPLLGVVATRLTLHWTRLAGLLAGLLCAGLGLTAAGPAPSSPPS